MNSYITFFYNLASPLQYCNFDNNNWCGWSRSYEGSGTNYWWLNQRGTAVDQTGPNNDYTTMASNGIHG